MEMQYERGPGNKPKRKWVPILIIAVMVAIVAAGLFYYLSGGATMMTKATRYNQELEEIIADSAGGLDTALINRKYDANNWEAMTTEELANLRTDSGFMKLLETETELMYNWEPIKNFKSYAGIKPDTGVLSLIRRCASFDRAPFNAERVPVARGARAVFLELRLFNVEVPVAFHIIINSRREGLQGNMVGRINDQIQLMNTVYKPFNIQFRPVSIDTTVNDTWFTRASYYTDTVALQQMTSRLSKTPERVMNVYILSSEVLGEATYPWYSGNGTSADYVVINYNTLAGGPDSFFEGMYKEGKTLVHEAGHYLGLLHTFEGGNFACNAAPPHDGCTIGDQVDDTPSQLVCYFVGCDENADSCPTEPGKDPVKNYMGYNPDACMTEFTKGQGDRLLQSIDRFRRHLITNR
jgi:predicted Zn-dependent protease